MARRPVRRRTPRKSGAGFWITRVSLNQSVAGLVNRVLLADIDWEAAGADKRSTAVIEGIHLNLSFGNSVDSSINKVSGAIVWGLYLQDEDAAGQDPILDAFYQEENVLRIGTLMQPGEDKNSTGLKEPSWVHNESHYIKTKRKISSGTELLLAYSNIKQNVGDGTMTTQIGYQAKIRMRMS